MAVCEYDEKARLQLLRHTLRLGGDRGDRRARCGLQRRWRRYHQRWICATQLVHGSTRPDMRDVRSAMCVVHTICAGCQCVRA
jgi:hypothetical protein